MEQPQTTNPYPQRKTIEQLLDELSFASRQTSGASFVIMHEKESGKFYVAFNNSFQYSKAKLKPTDFQTALEEAIIFLYETRKELHIPEKFTLYSRA